MEKDDSFTLGTGVSYYAGSDTVAPGRNELGYYASASIDKKIFKHFFVKSGIDAYTVPGANTTLIGTINLNLLYTFKVSDRITASFGTGLFTGFIDRKESSGLTSGALVSTIIRYKLNGNYDVGINIKYPFFTEISEIILCNAFFTF